MKMPLALVLLTTLVTAASAGEVRPLSFALRNERETPAAELVRVSLPVPAGQIPGSPAQFIVHGAQPIPAQATILTRHPDGSVRRVMLSFPVRLAAHESKQFTCEPAAGSETAPALAQVEGTTARIGTEPLDLEMREDQLQIRSRQGAELGVLRPFGPTLADAQPSTLTVLENGPVAVWLRWRQDGSDYTREVDLQADKLGHVRLVQRILRHLADNDWSPDFGFELSATDAKESQLPERPIHFLPLPAAEPFKKHPELVAALRLADGTSLALANPLAPLQHRGSLEASRSGATTTVRFSRMEPVAEGASQLILQEGMWQTLEVVLQPGTAQELATAVDQPLQAHADWRLYEAVYRTGPPLEVQHPLLKTLVERYVVTLQGFSLPGDDWGNLGGLDRYNHCQYIWEDYFRTGDPRLRQVALDYSENYRNFSVYWGPNQDHYGGGRYPLSGRAELAPGVFHTRSNDAVTFCTKGYHSFWLSYEETADPRFREAAEAQACWSADHVHATVNYTRCIGQVLDFVKLYEYTGDGGYLAQAERLWSEFQACQNPDLLFNERGVPSTGNDLYVPEDKFGYEHPFVKAYIVQYALNALPYLLAHRPDDRRLRDTIVACSDWMARVQTAGGGWAYPGPSTAGFHWNIEYCHGLMCGYEVEPKPAYLDSIGRDLRAIATLFDAHGQIPSGVTPWETLEGKSADDLARMYHLASDRPRDRDFTDGRLTFGIRADSDVYLQVLLRDYLRHRPEDSLFTKDAILEQIHRMPAAEATPH